MTDIMIYSLTIILLVIFYALFKLTAVNINNNLNGNIVDISSNYYLNEILNTNVHINTENLKGDYPYYYILYRAEYDAKIFNFLENETHKILESYKFPKGDKIKGDILTCIGINIAFPKLTVEDIGRQLNVKDFKRSINIYYPDSSRNCIPAKAEVFKLPLNDYNLDGIKTINIQLGVRV